MPRRRSGSPLLPPLARAEQDRRLAGELAGYATALLVVSIPLVLAAEFAADPLGGLLTGNESVVAGSTAADALQWMVPAGVVYLFAGLAASGLAALDDYATAAAGFALGSATGLVFILARVEPDGIVAIAWGMMLTASVALARSSHRRWRYAHCARECPERPFVRAARRCGVGSASFAVGAALPIALQLLYVVSLPFAAKQGAGAATSFVYAYLAASALVTVTAGSLGLVTAVPLARTDVTVAETVRHVVSSSWFAFVFVAGAAGALAVAGGKVVSTILGSSYGGDVGADLGQVIVALSPWMIASIGVSVTFPLAFVAGRTRRLPWIAAGALVLQVPLAWVGSSLLDLDGLALALACSTLVVLVALLSELGALAGATRGLVGAALVIGSISVASFAPPALVLGALASAVVGLVIYVALLALVRPRALSLSWGYLRALR